MPEYCSKCSPCKEFKEWDIDLYKIALILKNGHSVRFICEGCNNRSLYKSELGIYFLGKEINGEIYLFPITIEDLTGDYRK